MRYLRMTIVILFIAAAITLPVAPHAAAANTTLEAESMLVSPGGAVRTRRRDRSCAAGKRAHGIAANCPPAANWP